LNLPFHIQTGSPEETERLGHELGILLKPGDWVALIGPLGSGKTCFVRGVAAARGVSSAITSPTFTLIRRYDGSVGEVWHVDAYRLQGHEALKDVGLEDLPGPEGVVLVEWADRLAGWFSGFPHYEVSFTITSMRERHIVIQYVHGS